PQGRHVLLAACQDCETASDSVKSEKRGAFSYFLMETLRNNGKLTYRDLFKQANALVRSHVSKQSPQFEFTDSGDENQVFLNGAIIERKPYFTASYNEDYGWVIDGGAVHGVKGYHKGETTLLALFPIGCNDLHDPSKSVGNAEVTQVLPSQSKLKISDDNLSQEDTFIAVIIRTPVPPLGVYFDYCEGEEAGVNLARKALHLASFGNQPSAYIREEQELAKAEFRLLCRDEQYLIVRPADDRPLVAQIDGYTIKNAEKAIRRLEHIARWNAIVQLESRPDSSIQSGDVKMTLLSEKDEELSQFKEIRLEYKYNESQGKWIKPRVKLELTNNSDKTLHCTVVDLGDLFDISNPFFKQEGSVRLEAGQSIRAVSGKPFSPEVPDELWQQGITEYKDILKLIVCTAEFDANLMVQKKLDVPRREEKSKTRSLSNQGTLNHLMNRVQNRAFGLADEESYDDWYTEQIVVTTVRPLHNIKVSSTQQQKLREGVKLQPHPSLQAKVGLTTAPQVSRDVGNKIVPPIFQDDPNVTQSFHFNVSYGTAPELSILELNNVEDHTVVTPDAPLKLVVDTPLQDNEYVLPIGYDGEFFLPLGLGKSTQNGKTEIEIERLPEPVSQGKRDLKGAIRICFQKVWGEKLRLKYQYPRLAVAEIDDENNVTYKTDDVAVVKQRVTQAERIVLYIPGSIGDTKSLVSSLKQPVKIENNNRFIRELHDLVLTFDYENLNTPIEENTRLLKQRLEQVGLGANHGKVLHIVAHSMGGLVSRWFIEQEGGNNVVQHLIMLGTPNAGSPWATVKEWATLVMAVGMNSLSQTPLPVKALGSLSEAIMNTVDVALDQMQPNSQFIQALAASNDPGIPYSIIAGNTSISPAALQEEGKQATRFKRLMKKLFDKVVALPFLGEPNDIAVTVQSIKSLPDGWSVSPFIQEVACNHLTYFNYQESLKAVLTALAQESESNILHHSMASQK
ncbi:MAG: caspase, partial [Coleofasciculus sp. C2-GNP5-27]